MTTADSPVVLRWDGRVLHAAITGRATGPAIDAFADALHTAVDTAGPFAVLFDRRAMTAPTADGRAALDRWAATLAPRLTGRCAAWADLFDPRRAASLARAATSHRPGPYPQRTFTDPAAARTWIDTHL